MMGNIRPDRHQLIFGPHCDRNNVGVIIELRYFIYHLNGEFDFDIILSYFIQYNVKVAFTTLRHNITPNQILA